MRQFTADTFALIVFCTIAAGLIEWLVVGLSPVQMLYARMTAIPVIVATARPYGIYRNWIFARFPEQANRQTGAAVLDILSFVTFQAPLYVAILLFAGADWAQIATAVPAAMIAMVLSGRPYGIFLEWCRRLFGVAGRLPAV